MTEWRCCHKDWLCATVLVWDSWCAFKVPCLISFTHILYFGEARVPDPIRWCKNLGLTICSVYIATLFVSISHPSFIPHIFYYVIIIQHFFHELRFNHGARETSSAITEKWINGPTTKDLTPKWMLQFYFFLKREKNIFIKNKMLTTTAYRVVRGVLLTYPNKDWSGKYHPLKIQWSNHILSG